jgi:hypothetical protein
LHKILLVTRLPRSDSPGIPDRHGRVMMNGWDTTVAPSHDYVVFINPGGKEENPPPSPKAFATPPYCALERHLIPPGKFGEN